MASAIIQLESLSCPSCLQDIQVRLESLDGVSKETIKILFNSSKLKLDFDDKLIKIGTIEAVVEALGYGVLYTKVRER